MKIAVVTEDGNSISQHFGRAPYYAVLTVEDGQITGRELREKAAHQHGAGHEHAHDAGQSHDGPAAAHRHGQMIEPITDCQVLLARGMGGPAYQSLQAAGIQPILTDVPSIEVAVADYLAGTLVDHRERLH